MKKYRICFVCLMSLLCLVGCAGFSINTPQGNLHIFNDGSIHVNKGVYSVSLPTINNNDGD